MSKILILNAAPRKNGNTADLICAFTEGALENQNEVRDIYLADKAIHTCMGCTACTRNGGNCVQKDDMYLVYDGMGRCNRVCIPHLLQLHYRSSQDGK